MARFSRALGKVEKLKDDKVRLVEDVSAAKAKEKALQKQLDSAKADLAASKGEVAHLKKELMDARAREEDLASAQGEMLRALAEQIFRSGAFGSLVAALNDVMATRRAAETLDKVVVDYPTSTKKSTSTRCLRTTSLSAPMPK